MPEVNRDFTLSKKNLAEVDLQNLKESGLTDQTIRANGLYTEGGALVFPYRDLKGVVNCFRRLRFQIPKKDKNGRSYRYHQDDGTTNRGYYPFASLELLTDDTQPLYIVEGEKKALALSHSRAERI